MRSLLNALPVLLIVFAGAGCFGSESERCGSTVCPPGFECASSHGVCILPTQRTLCANETEGATCVVDGQTGYHCDRGVCIPGRCGDGVTDHAEQCDDGEENSDSAADACRLSCRAAGCGDGVVDTLETCDDGNRVAGDGCSFDCRSDESCGNGVVDLEAGELCDDGNGLGGDGCSDSCQPEVCGDAVLDEGEACDDGNNLPGDGCSADCRSNETCGNGRVDGQIASAEQCDCGNAPSDVPPGCTAHNGVSPSHCRQDCQVTTCGDGYAGGGEECDAADLAGEQCSTIGLGFTAGNLSCQPDCAYDTSHCFTCGDGACEVDAGESPTRCMADCAAVAVATLDDHSCALLADGSLQCWGSNYEGQLGDGTTTPRNHPVTVQGVSDAVAIAAGGNFTCALLANGTVVCWGSIPGAGVGVGQPGVVPGLASVTAVAAGTNFACALKSDGTVWCWGSSTYGTLGDGGAEYYSHVPVQVLGLSSAVALGAGHYHVCAVTSPGGAVHCWGHNNHGQLGDGSTQDRDQPVQVVGLSGAVTVRGAGNHTCAQLTNGTVQCWGNNFSGELGDGTQTNRPTAAPVSNLSSASEITLGFNTSCAALSTGSVECWGNNTGNFGNGGLDDASVPTPGAVGLSAVTSLACGSTHTCAVDSGAVYCWGGAFFSQLGDSTGDAAVFPSGVSWFTDPGCLSEFASDTHYRGCQTNRPFEDISASGTLAGITDDGHWVISLSYDLGFYSQLYSAVSLHSNGAITFVDAAVGTNDAGSCLPAAAGGGGAMIAPFWDDLDPSTGGGQGVYYESRGGFFSRRFIAQWNATHFSVGGGTASFQVVIHQRTGNIEFRYQDVDFGDPTVDSGASATVGIQGSPTGPSVQFSCNQANLSSQSSITFFRQ